jgi:hypothetical protein
MASPLGKPRMRRPMPTLALVRQHPCRCPVCGGNQHTLVSEESRQRDVSEDTFSLTPFGRRVLEELREDQERRQREAAIAVRAARTR